MTAPVKIAEKTHTAGHKQKEVNVDTLSKTELKKQLTSFGLSVSGFKLMSRFAKDYALLCRTMQVTRMRPVTTTK